MLAIAWGSTVALPFAAQYLLTPLVPLVTALTVRLRDDKVVHIVVAVLLSSLLAVWALLTDDVPNDTFLQVAAAFLTPIIATVTLYETGGKALKINQKLAPNKGI